ncbi:MAG: hypothetical protein LBH54_04535, partial [Clostridiales bacterium]|nr:hypothetical protein [Clostridiales bacterium]
MKLKLFLTAAAVFLALYPPCAASEIGLYAEEYQEIMGWGGFPSYARSDWSADGKFAPPVHRPGVYDALFRDSGLTIYRIDYQPRFYNGVLDDGTLNTNAIDDVMTVVETARDYGVTDYLVSIWTPPSAMKSIVSKVSGHMNDALVKGYDGVNYKSGLLADREPDFIRYVCDVTAYIDSLGLPLPTYISLQNEPTHAIDYDSCFYTSEQYIRVLKNLRTALDARGFGGVKLIAGEGNNFDYNDSLFQQTYQKIHLNDTLNNAIDTIAVHAYAQDTYAWNRNTFARDVFRTFDKPLMQSE